MRYAVAFLVLAAMCLLPAQGSGQDEPAASAESWVGRSADELISKWGEPSRTKHLRNGEQLFVYKIVLVEGSVVGWGTPIGTSNSIHPVDLAPPGASAKFAYASYREGTPVYSPDTIGSPAAGKLKARFRIQRDGTIAEAKIEMKFKKRKNAPE